MDVDPSELTPYTIDQEVYCSQQLHLQTLYIHSEVFLSAFNRWSPFFFPVKRWQMRIYKLLPTQTQACRIVFAWTSPLSAVSMYQ
jgi:hypothetical protein